MTAADKRDAGWRKQCDVWRERVAAAEERAEKEREERSNLALDMAALADCIDEIARQANTGEAERDSLNSMRDAMWRIEYARLSMRRARDALAAQLAECRAELADYVMADEYRHLPKDPARLMPPHVHEAIARIEARRAKEAER